MRPHLVCVCARVHTHTHIPRDHWCKCCSNPRGPARDYPHVHVRHMITGWLTSSSVLCCVSWPSCLWFSVSCAFCAKSCNHLVWREDGRDDKTNTLMQQTSLIVSLHINLFFYLGMRGWGWAITSSVWMSMCGKSEWRTSLISAWNAVVAACRLENIPVTLSVNQIGFHK